MKNLAEDVIRHNSRGGMCPGPFLIVGKARGTLCSQREGRARGQGVGTGRTWRVRERVFAAVPEPPAETFLLARAEARHRNGNIADHDPWSPGSPSLTGK